MFKRVLESLSRSLGGGKPAPAKTPSPPVRPGAPMQTPAAKPGSLIDKVGGTTKPSAQKNAAAKPEEMCGITAKMTKEQIGAQLKLLYRRYNRSASSLNNSVRVEADGMLDAIVTVREKTFGEL